MKHVYTPFLLSVLLILTNCISPKTNESAISEEIEIKEVRSQTVVGTSDKVMRRAVIGACFMQIVCK